jgi:hypothetical protein
MYVGISPLRIRGVRGVMKKVEVKATMSIKGSRKKRFRGFPGPLRGYREYYE